MAARIAAALLSSAWLLRAALVEPKCDSVVDGVCKITTTKTSAEDSFQLTFDGDVVIDKGVRLDFKNRLVIQAGGKVTMEAESIARARVVQVVGTSIELKDKVFLQADAVNLLPNQGNCSMIKISGIDVRVVAKFFVEMKCPDGHMQFDGPGTVIESGTARGPCSRPDTGIDWDFVFLSATALFGPKFEVNASLVRVETTGNLVMAAKAKIGARLYLKSGNHLHMGDPGGDDPTTWKLCRLRAIAENIFVETGHGIWTEHSSINLNREVPNQDLCFYNVLEEASLDMLSFRQYTEFQGRAIMFDAMIVAQKDIHIAEGSRLLAAALLVCARNHGYVGKGVLLSAGGRGRPPGNGDCSGETRDGTCGGGGASSFRAGGSGATFTAVSVTPCASPGGREWCSTSFRYSSLPTVAASGGGCGVPDRLCMKLGKKKERPSAGGGLIWISVRELRTSKEVQISANGYAGIAFGSGGKEGVSGGGAGGQIIMFIKSLYMEDKLVLSAEGGTAVCDTDKNIVAGAGAGGFVGVGWTGQIMEESGMLQALVDGGKLRQSCETSVPQEGWKLLHGEPGIATSLKQCDPGKAGIFCAACPVGKWVHGGFKCMDCRNKPKLRAKYTASSWTNESCPYECTQGKPPDCFCAAGSVGDTCEPCPSGTWVPVGKELCQACTNKPGGDDSSYIGTGGSTPDCPYICRIDIMDNKTCQCPAGFEGADCDPCPPGRWSTQGSKHCKECKNKPGQWAMYTATKWPSPDCPYECVPGVPKVEINPDCNCPAGYAGRLCEPCPVGTWSSFNSLECLPCKNKPGKFSVYTERAWSNPSCAYQCTSDVFNVHDNPKCLGSFMYAVEFYGGFQKISIILAMWVFAGVVLLYSRPRKMSFDREIIGERNGQFVHEKLPYHLCRIYLCGKNETGKAWALSSGRVPEALQDLVQQGAWDSFIAEFNWAAQCTDPHPRLTALLRLAQGSIAAQISLSQRRKRAESLSRFVRSRSEDQGRGLLWHSDEEGERQMQMILSCDKSATLGYLDFFDTSLELYDWKPVDLRREARFLVAHGLGTYLDPFALDVGDPLVEQLAQTDFRPAAVYSVVFAFNRLSRLVPKSELESLDQDTPRLAMLEAGVKAFANEGGLGKVARVVLLPQDRTPSQASQPVVELCPMEASFSELVQQVCAAEEASNRFEKGEGSFDGASTSRSRKTIGRDHRLCLLFLDATEKQQDGASSSSGGPPSLQDLPAAPGGRGAAAAPGPGGLTAAPTFPEECSVLEGMSPADHPPDAPAHLTSPLSHTVASRMAISIQGSAGSGRSGCLVRAREVRQRMLSIETSSSFRQQAIAFLMAMLLLLIDSMLSFLTVDLLVRKGWGHLLLWMLVPPFTPVLAAGSGLAFQVLDRPRLGRLHRSLVALSTINAVVACILLAWDHSFFVMIQELPIVCICKASLFFCTEVRIFDVEARRDHMQSFTKLREDENVDPIDAAGFKATMRDLSKLFSLRSTRGQRNPVSRRSPTSPDSGHSGICLTTTSSWQSIQEAREMEVDLMESHLPDLALTLPRDSITSEASMSSLQLTFLEDR